MRRDCSRGHPLKRSFVSLKSRFASTTGRKLLIGCLPKYEGSDVTAGPRCGTKLRKPTVRIGKKRRPEAPRIGSRGFLTGGSLPTSKISLLLGKNLLNRCSERDSVPTRSIGVGVLEFGLQS